MTRNGRITHDHFTTSGLGDMFVLKLAGFMSDHQARLLDVTPTSTRLVVGGRSFTDWFLGRDYMPKTELRFQFAPAASPGRTGQMNVDVQVRPRGLFARRSETVAKHLLRSVRGYFIVS